MRERGAGISTGQKQLISFARALAFNPPFLILDEATSSIDTVTELKIREALDRLVEGRTSIVVAHRLSTIQRADRIVVIHKGQLRESGTHQQLLAQRGIYWKLYQLQYRTRRRDAGRQRRRSLSAENGLGRPSVRTPNASEEDARWRVRKRPPGLEAKTHPTWPPRLPHGAYVHTEQHGEARDKKSDQREEWPDGNCR